MFKKYKFGFDYAVVGGVPAKVIKMLNPEEMKENKI